MGIPRRNLGIRRIFNHRSGIKILREGARKTYLYYETPCNFILFVIAEKNVLNLAKAKPAGRPLRSKWNPVLHSLMLKSLVVLATRYVFRSEGFQAFVQQRTLTKSDNKPSLFLPEGVKKTSSVARGFRLLSSKEH